MKKYAFYELFTQPITIESIDESKEVVLDGITIPMIQRDYAQGREDEYDIRVRFLKNIFQALQTDTETELDFVYGSLTTLDKKIYFVPLDGQQRLTTLFLLYWYIGNRELTEDNLQKVRDALSRFTYETRVSSREFCGKLSQITCSFKKAPSIEISESFWFYDSYRRDPTVKSMLVMLDAIHNLYSERSTNLYSKLQKVTFYILPLDGYHLSDELYIKMNARGKQLTGFENFKADLLNWMQNPNNPQSSTFTESVILNNETIPFYLAFSFELDGRWAKYFWIYAKNTESKIIDHLFMKFLHRYLLNCFIITPGLPQEAVDGNDNFKYFYNEEERESSIKYAGFSYYENILGAKDVLTNMEKILNNLGDKHCEIDRLIAPSWNTEKWNLMDSPISQRQRIVFYAVCTYLQTADYETLTFKQWMRVVWNLVIDPDVRSNSAMVSVMRLIMRLSVGSHDVYNYLNGQEVAQLIKSERGFIQSQLEEEQFKARLILNDNKWEMLFIEAEMHGLFLGNITFMLDNSVSEGVFKNRLKNAQYIFSDSGTSLNFHEKNILIRYIISKTKEWEDLESLDFSDDHNNWQMLLRRNKMVQNTIRDLCDVNSYDDLFLEIQKGITDKSGIINLGSNNVPLFAVHEKLYQIESFHTWLQLKGAVNLKWYNENLYVYRPRSWYDWVILNTIRNELITTMIQNFRLETTQRCGLSEFYWDSHVFLSRAYSECRITVYFDDKTSIFIGIKDDMSSNSAIPNDGKAVPGWLYCKRFEYERTASKNRFDTVITEIHDSIFDEDNKDSLIYKIRNHITCVS